MIKAWQVLSSRYLLDEHWLKLREDRVRTSRGAVLDEFHVLECPSWACVVCVTQEQELVLIEQYRHGVGRTTLELPAGVIEEHELPLDGAQRELLEETGYHAEEWTQLGVVLPEPSRHTHRAHLFAALGARRAANPRLDASEDIQVRLHSLTALDGLLDSGGIEHGVHVAALLLAERRGSLAPPRRQRRVAAEAPFAPETD